MRGLALSLLALWGLSANARLIERNLDVYLDDLRTLANANSVVYGLVTSLVLLGIGLRMLLKGRQRCQQPPACLSHVVTTLSRFHDPGFPQLGQALVEDAGREAAAARL